MPMDLNSPGEISLVSSYKFHKKNWRNILASEYLLYLPIDKVQKNQYSDMGSFNKYIDMILPFFDHLTT